MVHAMFAHFSNVIFCELLSMINVKNENLTGTIAFKLLDLVIYQFQAQFIPIPIMHFICNTQTVPLITSSEFSCRLLTKLASSLSSQQLYYSLLQTLRLFAI